jgi:hypothetical protein
MDGALVSAGSLTSDKMAVGWLVSWLVSWLVGWSVRQSVARVNGNPPVAPSRMDDK